VAMAGLDASQLATVFTSATGDPANCHALCEALATPARLVSPTRFTNSVHNAGAGYWHIAIQGLRASTSIAGLDASFGAGLLEAAVQCQASQAPVLLVASDVVYPEPLHALRPLVDVFAVAMVIAPAGAQAQQAAPAQAWQAAPAPAPQTDPLAPAGQAEPPWRLNLQWGTSLQAGGEMGDLTPALDQLRLGNPAARCLPLLQNLALGSARNVVLECAHGSDTEPACALLVQHRPQQERDLSSQPGRHPATLDRAGIAARIPHAGSMCLLHSLVSWDASHLHCTATSHTDPHNPLREGGALLAPVAIEYAAQAMALHGGLTAPPGTPPQPGFLVSARGVQMWVPDLAQVPGPLQVRVEQQAGHQNQALYRFTVHSEQGQLLVQGRATVVLNSPLPLPMAVPAPPPLPSLSPAAVPAPSPPPQTF
jgi:predicted hotdog family 3-hydroxylacyl-ACP dehydratase